MQVTMPTGTPREPCVFCGGKMVLKESRGTARTDGTSSTYWREECQQCFSSKEQQDNGPIRFIRSGHPLSEPDPPTDEFITLPRMEME